MRTGPFLALTFTTGLALVYFFSHEPVLFQKPAPSFNADFALDKQVFFSAINDNIDSPPNHQPKIVILPHHQTASNLIALGLSMFESSPPANIIIISPNHSNTGHCDIVTSRQSWSTFNGSISINQDIINRFIDSSTCLDDSIIGSEHGIATLLPFIAHYLPDTKIIPFAIKKDPQDNVIDRFVANLTSLSEDTVILATIDFSHGLSQREAMKRDQFTQNLISERQVSEILHLSSEYLDSPPALAIVLRLADRLDLDLNIYKHLDSSAINGNRNQVTTYFLITSQTKPGLGSYQYSLLFTGDVMLGRSVNTRIIKHHDYSWPFQKVSSLLASADLSIINLESPFSPDCRPTDTGMIFCANPQSVEGLVLSGVDIASLANNHIGNQGSEGIKITTETLRSNDIEYVGLGVPVFTNLYGTRIAFLSFNDIPPFTSGISTATPENIRREISLASQSADLTIAIFHWGQEYQLKSIRQQELAHLAIDSGADLVVGHHPHWIQEIEEYHGKPIYYSLGNFVFDQMWSQETSRGLVIKLGFIGTHLTRREHILVDISDYGQPSIVSKPIIPDILESIP